MGRRRLESESVKRGTKTKEIKKKTTNNNNKLDKRNKTTDPSKIGVICAQNVWQLIFMLDFSTFRTSKREFPIQSLLSAFVH